MSIRIPLEHWKNALNMPMIYGVVCNLLDFSFMVAHIFQFVVEQRYDAVFVCIVSSPSFNS